jgi:hypothetical protein
MPRTYEPIATTAVSSTVTEVIFSSISSAYTDLILVVAPTAGALADTGLQFNSDTGANYSRTYLNGNGTSAISGRNSGDTRIRTNYSGATGGSNGMQIIQIMNYANSTTNKSVLIRANNASYGTDAVVGLWRSTAAITSLRIYCDGGGNWTAGNFTLYGIKAA